MLDKTNYCVRAHLLSFLCSTWALLTERGSERGLMMTGIDPDVLLQQFASDNYAGICPAASLAMEVANQGHATAYGDDPWTAKASDEFRELFEIECEVFFVFNGTAANSLALASLCQSYHRSEERRVGKECTSRRSP